MTGTARQNLFSVLLTGLIASCVTPTSAKPGKSISVETKAISHFLPGSPDKTMFGDLKFLGGFELRSKHEDFGGISGVRLLQGGGDFLAVTDQGHWLSGQIKRDDLKPVGLAKMRMGRLRKASGKKLKGKRNSDAEGLEYLGKGDGFLISFERNHRAARFTWQNEKLRQLSGIQEIDLNSYDLENNHGPEAIARSPLNGDTYIFPEGDEVSDALYRGFKLDKNGISDINVIREGPFRITDAAFSKNGDLFLLERHYNPIVGVSMRIRRFTGAILASGDSLTGEALIEANWQYEIDNMEGLALSELPDGSTRLTIISDDNFSRSQRTLLLEFQLVE